MYSSRILIFLDALIDTRIGCVRAVNEEWVDDLVKNGYHKRMTNKLSLINPNIDDAAILARWNTRDVEVLKLGFSTEILPYIFSVIRQNKTLEQDHPDFTNTSITLNIWPYKLTKVQIDTFTEVIKGALCIEDVKCVNINIDMLSPMAIKQKYDHVILYDMNEWIGHHKDRIPKIRMPDVIITNPLCVLDSQNPDNLNPKEMITVLNQMFANYFIIDVVPLEMMSYYAG